MTFEEFLAAWNRALVDSRLPRTGFNSTSLDLANLDREVKTGVEPLGGQYAGPFFVTAGLAFRWSALQTARGATIEEDVLVELLGRDGAADVGTDHPWVRVDVTFSATVPYGKPLPMPPPERWAAWSEEVTTRLTEFDPVVADEEDETGEDLFAIGAWQGSPKATFACAEDGALQLESIEIEAWQAIRVPRHWDDPDREPDDLPDAQLDRMLTRVRKALHVWTEVLDQLKARTGRRSEAT
jgi:hypothetical protein